MLIGAGQTRPKPPQLRTSNGTNYSAIRRVRAAMVSVELAHPEIGNTEVPAT
jgi:hypothetical protein